MNACYVNWNIKYFTILEEWTKKVNFHFRNSINKIM